MVWAPAMSAASSDRLWIPLGNAQIIDWKHLDRAPSARGATAWVGTLDGEATLVRTWCEETTTYFEFLVLAHEGLTGRLTVRVARPEQNRLHVKIDAVASGLEYTETVELAEHPRTGLQGYRRRDVVVRTGSLEPADLPSLGAAEAEILEYAPESALHTGCGHWLARVLARLCQAVLARPEPTADGPRTDGATKPPPGFPSEPRRSGAPGSSPAIDLQSRRAGGSADVIPPDARTGPTGSLGEIRAPLGGSGAGRVAPSSSAMQAPTPLPAKPRKLFASTNAGDSWEIVDPETYIGRSKQCMIVLKSQRVSRKHASVTQENEGWFINDLGAANGIWAGAEKIDRELIEDGAEYIIGDVLLTFTYS